MRYSPSMMRCSRSRTRSTLLVLVGPSPPETSAPHVEQNLLLSGMGVWQRKHSTTPLVIGGGAGSEGGQRVPGHAGGAWRGAGRRGAGGRGVLSGGGCGEGGRGGPLAGGGRGGCCLLRARGRGPPAGGGGAPPSRRPKPACRS